MTASDSIRVAMLTTSYPMFPGDFSGHFVEKLTLALAAQGCAMRVHAPHHARSLERETMGGVEVERFRYAPQAFERVAFGHGIAENLRTDPLAVIGLPPFVAALRRAAVRAQRRADLLHVHWAPTAGVLPRSLVPMVLTVHGSDAALALGGGVWRRLFEKAVRCASAVLAVSEQVASEIAPHVDDAGKIRVVPTGVDRELTERPSAPQTVDGPVRIAFVGRLLESKGVVDLAKAFASMPKGTTRLALVGKGPAEGRARAALEAGGRLGEAEFLGALPHEGALEAMAAADVVVMPSHREGCGLVAIEGAALGRAVVGTRVGVLPRLLADDRLLIEAGDAEGLAARLDALARDPAARAEAGARLRGTVARDYTWEALAAKVSAVYREVTGGG